METEQLGKRVAEHQTDNFRRRRTAIGCLVVAAIGLGAGVPLSIAYFTASWEPTSADPRFWSGGLIGLGVLSLIVGVLLLAKAVRTKGEGFEVYEQGIVYHIADTVSVIR